METQFRLKTELNGSKVIDIPQASLAAMLLAINHLKREDELADHLSDLTVKNFGDYFKEFTTKSTTHLVLGYLARNGLAEVEDGISNSITLTEKGINVIYDIIETNQVPDNLLIYTPAQMAGQKDVTGDPKFRLGAITQREDDTMSHSTTIERKVAAKTTAQAKTSPASLPTVTTEPLPQLKAILKSNPCLQFHFTKTEQFGQLTTPRCRVTVYATKNGVTIYAYRVRGDAATLDLEQINNLLFKGKGEVKKVYSVYRTADLKELTDILALA